MGGRKHPKKRDKRSVALTQYDRTTTNYAQTRLPRRRFHAFQLFRRENTRKKSAHCQMRRRHGAIVRYIAAKLEAAGDFLRMIPFYARAGRKIRRTAQHQVKLFLRR